MKSTLFSIILFLLSSPLFSQNDTLTFTIRGVRFDMVRIEGATYQKPNYYGDTMNRLNYHVPKPVKYANSMNGYSTVVLSSYYIGKFEVTQDLYQAVLGKKSNHSYYPYNYNSNARSWKMVKDEGPFLRYPVDRVTWKEAQRFVDSLNAITGLRFRLPTEAEWEYAASGGELGQRHGAVARGRTAATEQIRALRHERKCQGVVLRLVLPLLLQTERDIQKPQRPVKRHA